MLENNFHVNSGLLLYMMAFSQFVEGKTTNKLDNFDNINQDDVNKVGTLYF